MRQGFFGAICLACCAMFFSSSSWAEDYRFSPVNQYGINLTAEYWTPIINYVSDKSGVKLTLKIGRTSAETTDYVLNDEVEFIFSNGLFSPDREKLGWKVFARRNMPAVFAELVVAQDSTVRKLEDLEGEEVAFVSPESLITYKFPYAQLLAEDITVKPVFAGNMDGVLNQLFSAKVKAAGVNSQLAEAYVRRENRKLRVLWRSEPLNDLALMVSAKVPEKTARAVAKAFLAMHLDPRGRAVLRHASRSVGLPDDAYFISSNGSEYAAYRKFYQTAPSQLR